MPYRIIPEGGHFRLRNMHTGKTVPVKYKSKASSIGAARRFIMYREKVPSIVRPRLMEVLPKKKKKKTGA